MNQQKSLLLFGGRICQELSRQPFLSKDYQDVYKRQHDDAALNEAKNLLPFQI